MKKIFVTLFAMVCALTIFSLSADAQVTCGVPGTEGMPSCSTVSSSNQKCCIPPHYKGVKTVIKGNKAQANSNQNSNTAVIAENVSATASVSNGPDAYAAAPNQISANVVSVTESVSAASATAVKAAGATKSANSAKASKSASAAKASK